MSFFQSCGKLPTTVLAVKTANDIKRIIAFAFNEKSFAIAFLVFFSFSSLFLDGLPKAFQSTFYYILSKKGVTKISLIPWTH